MTQARDHLVGVDYAVDLQAAVRGASATVIVTEWDVFRALDLVAIRENMAHPLLIDLRNIYSASEAAAAGLIYHSIGRSQPSHRDVMEEVMAPASEIAA
jgi:UDPglucose 6-dehydrogenase